jgi:hypothetical protein
MKDIWQDLFALFTLFPLVFVPYPTVCWKFLKQHKKYKIKVCKISIWGNWPQKWTADLFNMSLIIPLIVMIYEKVMLTKFYPLPPTVYLRSWTQNKTGFCFFPCLFCVEAGRRSPFFWRSKAEAKNFRAYCPCGTPQKKNWRVLSPWQATDIIFFIPIMLIWNICLRQCPFNHKL